MRTETIDGIVHYVWKAGDEFPDYQPIECKWRTTDKTNLYPEGVEPVDWCLTGEYDRLWPKLINDRARHQRMIDEAFEKLSCDKEPFDFYTIKSDMEHALVDYGIFNEECMLFLVKSSANIKRMMEHVQAEIDKEESK